MIYLAEGLEEISYGEAYNAEEMRLERHSDTEMMLGQSRLGASASGAIAGVLVQLVGKGLRRV